jgi:hypothetical protein
MDDFETVPMRLPWRPPLTLNAKLKGEQIRLPPRPRRAQVYNNEVAHNRLLLGGFAALPGAFVRRISIRLKRVIGYLPVALIAIGVLLTLAWIGVLVWTSLFFLAG